MLQNSWPETDMELTADMRVPEHGMNATAWV